MAARDGFLLPGRVLADGPGALRTKLVMPVERHPQHFWPTLVRRGVWLAGLMILQSISSVILQNHAKLIEEHFVITLFLTMLVGAGGNAGNQSTVLVVRELATGEITQANERAVVWRETLMGFFLGLGLFCISFMRVYMKHNFLSSVAISVTLFFIVFTATIVGTLLPLFFVRLGWDPAHAGPTIQVVMDITGVLLTCTICSAFFGALAVYVDPLALGTEQL